MLRPAMAGYILLLQVFGLILAVMLYIGKSYADICVDYPVGK